MFMGSAAFSYYFPVIDRYLREVIPADENDDCLAWIIGCGITAQLESTRGFGNSFLAEIAELARFVRKFPESFDLADIERQRIREVWTKVEALVGEMGIV